MKTTLICLSALVQSLPLAAVAGWAAASLIGPNAAVHVAGLVGVLGAVGAAVRILD